MQYPIGTIIRKAFNKVYYEGEVIRYDEKEGFYKISYLDGDSEEMTHAEVKKYKKPIQKYSPGSKKAQDHAIAKGLKTAALIKYYWDLENRKAQQTNAPNQLDVSFQAYSARARQLEYRGIALAAHAGMLSAFKAGAIWDEDMKK